MARREATILVRIDNMAEECTEGQRSIRFELPETAPGAHVNELVALALARVPDPPEWSAY